ncbi:hypothetical protein V5T82_14485 [Magnetovibrio sp. PR-2]|uniref:hypothetical protein n=1 Tax=Magnetovibrio sp. PR-2 TaxID=3120356 RepID=UPI002FCE1E95
MSSLTDQYQVYVDQYRSQASLILKGVPPFRDTQAVDQALAKLKDVFQEIDAEIAKINAAKKELSQSEQAAVKLLGKKLNATIQATSAIFPTVEQQDITYIQSAKVATLDQPKLKALAAKLAVVDQTFCGNIEGLMADDEPSEDQPTWDIQRMDADGENAPNVPEDDDDSIE